MKIVPPYVTAGFRSNAEKKFFECLHKAELQGDWTAYHSLNISEHEYKRWAEIDFVIVGPKGVYAFEVKGGRVARNNGIWEFTDRYGRIHKKSEGPFEQVDSAMHALKKKLEPVLSVSERRQLVMGWGVVFPDILFDIAGPEHPKQTICDSRYFAGDKSVDEYLSQLIGYWRSKPVNKGRQAFDDKSMQTVRKFIRRDFELVPTLGIQAGDIKGRMVRLTEGQTAILESSEHEERIACRGGAGTGKSFLALETARRESLGDGRNVIFVAKGSIYTASMRGYDVGERVHILTLDELSLEIESSQFTQADVLVVDEGQDLLDFGFFDVLSRSLKGGLEEGRWRWFMDPNNQAWLGGKQDSDALEYIEELATSRPMLTRNCRNTEQIINHTQQCTGADIGVAQVKGMGPPVIYKEVSSPLEEAQQLEAQLLKWIDQDVRLQDIAVLSAGNNEPSCMELLSGDTQKLLMELTEKNANNPPANKIITSRITEFKGLERAFVALIDLDYLDDSHTSIATLYVGMTRAHAGLWLAVGTEFSPLLQKWQESVLQKLLDSRSRNE